MSGGEVFGVVYFWFFGEVVERNCWIKMKIGYIRVENIFWEVIKILVK